MKFGRTIQEQAIVEWKSKYLDYESLKQLIKRVSNQEGEDSFHWTKSSKLIKEENDSHDEEVKGFLELLSAELRKVENFFLLQLNEARKRKKLLARYLSKLELCTESVHGQKITDDLQMHSKEDQWNSHERGDPQASLDETHLSLGTAAQPLGLSRVYLVHPWRDLFVMKNKNATKFQIRKAFIELYRYLELLKSYHSMNTLAYTKIVKKFEKNTNSDYHGRLVKNLTESTFFRNKEKVDLLMKEIVTIFTTAYCRGDRKKALRALLRSVNDFTVPTTLAQNQYFLIHRYTLGIYLTGLFTGLNIALFSALLKYLYFLDRPHSELDAIVLLYLGLGLPIFLGVLTSWNLITFDLFKVNYRLIYGLRANPFTTIVYSCAISFLAFLYLTFITLSIKSNGRFLFPDPITEIWFILLIVLFIGALYCFLFYPSNIWLLKVLGRLIITPYHQCKFKDFYITDQLSSCQGFFQCLGYLIYVSIHNSPSQIVLSGNSIPFSWYGVLLPTLPFYWRCIQCLRRYYDSCNLAASSPNTVQLWNSFRYFLGISSLVSIGVQAYFSKLGNHRLSLLLYCIMFLLRLLYSAFSYYWDIIMDWGLGKGRLAPQKQSSSSESLLIIYPTSFYYFAMVTDGIGRFLWLPFYILAFPTEHSPSSFHLFYAFYIYSFIEALRRFQWNFFRVEIEHVHNCEKYQVIREIQLPFASNDLFEFEDEEEENDDGELNHPTNDQVEEHDITSTLPILPLTSTPSSSFLNHISTFDIEN